MSVSTEKISSLKLNPVAGVAIDVDFPLFDKGDVYVLYGEVGITAIQDTDYTVALNEPNFADFTITPTAALRTKIDALIASDATETDQITIRRTMAMTTTMTETLARHRNQVSLEFDRTALRLAEVNDKADRAFKLSDAIADPEAYSLAVNPVANQALVFSSDGTKLQTADLTAGNTIAAANKKHEKKAGDGATLTFTLAEDPGSDANLLVFVDKLVNYDWSRAGKVITFDAAPPGDGLDTNVDFHYSDTTPVTDLSQDVLDELTLIGSTDISAAQWAILGGTNQGLATTDSVVFAGVTATSLSLGDNEKALFGDAVGGDFEIYHDGTNNRLKAINGGYFMLGDDIRFVNAASTESMLIATANGSVDLYYDNVKKFETTSAGATVTGDITLTGDLTVDNTLLSVTRTNTINLDTGFDVGQAGIVQWIDGGGSVTGTLPSASHSVTDTGAYLLFDPLEGTASEDLYQMQFHADGGGGNGLTYRQRSNGTWSAWAKFVMENQNGDTSLNGDVLLGDNQSLYIGDGNDLRLIHDGAHSYLQDNGTGDLYLDATNHRIRTGSTIRAEVFASGNVGAANNLAIGKGVGVEPDLRLDIKQSANSSSGGMRLTRSDTTNRADFYVDSSNQLRGGIDGNDVLLVSTSTVQARRDYAGGTGVWAINLSGSGYAQCGVQSTGGSILLQQGAAGGLLYASGGGNMSVYNAGAGTLRLGANAQDDDLIIDASHNVNVQNDLTTSTWQILSSAITPVGANGGSLLAEAASSTNPTVVPNKADPDTGIGWHSADNLSLISGGLEHFRLAPSTAGSTGPLTFVANLTTAPSSNPGGGGYLYAEGGALKWRGSSGTVTTIAAA